MDGWVLFIIIIIIIIIVVIIIIIIIISHPQVEIKVYHMIILQYYNVSGRKCVGCMHTHTHTCVIIVWILNMNFNRNNEEVFYMFF